MSVHNYRQMDRRCFLRLLLFTTFGTMLATQNKSWAQQEGRVMNDHAVKLFLCGDVMTGRGIDQILPHPSKPNLYEPYVIDAREYIELAEDANGPISKPVDYDYIWGDILEELQRQAADVRIINLETSVTTSNNYDGKGINYRMHPKNIPSIEAIGVDCCALANNHVLDWGREGLSETLITLNEAGINYAGAGRSLDEAQAPAIIELANKGRVLVFSFGTRSGGISKNWAAKVNRPGVNLMPDLSDVTVGNIAHQIRQIKTPRDIVVASIHWGGNWGYAISSGQRQFAHALIDEAGVDVIHGHSSHHIKGIEVYNERPIIYGCGDFLNDYEGISGEAQFRDDLGLMYFPSLDPESGRLLNFKMTATRIKNLRVNRATAEEAHWLLDVLNREGKILGTHAVYDDANHLILKW